LSRGSRLLFERGGPQGHPFQGVATPKRPGDLTAQELQVCLEKHQGNKTRVAAELGIAINTLKARMRAFGIETRPL
jgi:DNA-binding NtrC family response regulator